MSSYIWHIFDIHFLIHYHVNKYKVKMTKSRQEKNKNKTHTHKLADYRYDPTGWPLSGTAATSLEALPNPCPPPPPPPPPALPTLGYKRRPLVCLRGLSEGWMDLPTRALIEERLSPDIDGRLRTGLPLSRQVLVRPRLAALNWSCHFRPARAPLAICTGTDIKLPAV